MTDQMTTDIRAWEVRTAPPWPLNPPQPPTGSMTPWFNELPRLENVRRVPFLKACGRFVWTYIERRLWLPRINWRSARWEETEISDPRPPIPSTNEQAP